MEIQKLTSMCLEIRLPHGKPRRVLMMPDTHFDNPKCNRDKFHRLMKKAVEDEAMVFFYGDFFCLMEGRYDPRRSRSGIRPEYNKNNYLDLVINDAADNLAPYAHNIVMMGTGNHEDTISKHLDTCPLERLCERINMQTGSKIHKMGYHGFIMFKFQSSSRTRVVTLTKYFHHGAYGGAVTKGTLGVMRHGAVTPDADIVVTGHTHDHWSMEQPRYRLSAVTGEVKIESQVHLKVGTLKEEFATDGGWAVQKLVLPKSMAGWWCDISCNKYNKKIISYFPANS